MEGLFILNNVFILVLIIISFMLMIFELVKHSGYLLVIISVSINLFVIVYSLLKGAEIKEILILLFLFIIPHLMVFSKGRK